MECLSPLKIYNPRKFFALNCADTYVNYVRCGKCANCQETLSKEWYFRAYYEYLDTVQNNGYMYMDCLTYAPKYVPRVSRFIPKLPRHLNFMCFDYTDIRYFLVRLRRYLSYHGFDIKNSFRYFFSTEYGTSEEKTHRPHVHLLFYVTTPSLDSITLSRAISHCWKYGRTDGLPYKSRRYVLDNTISGSLTSAIRSCKYVSKYVMKDSLFQKVVNKRIAAIMHYLYETRFTRYEADWFSFDGKRVETVREYVDYTSYESWSKSETAKKYLRDIRRYCNQFHRQSLGFGASWLKSANVEDIIRDNIISIPDGKKIVNRIGLPMYYRRKLFYYYYYVNGVMTWQPTTIGKRYLKQRYEDRKRQLFDEFSLSYRNYGVKINPEEMTDYILNARGRINGVKPSEDLDEVLASPLKVYNYVTSSDKMHFSQSFVTSTYVGCSNIYKDGRLLVNVMSPADFVSQWVIFDKEKEKLLEDYQREKAHKLEGLQQNFDNKQRLNQIYKTIYN